MMILGNPCRIPEKRVNCGRSLQWLSFSIGREQMKDETYKIILTVLASMTLWWHMWLRAWKQMKMQEIREKYRNNEHE